MTASDQWAWHDIRGAKSMLSLLPVRHIRRNAGVPTATQEQSECCTLERDPYPTTQVELYMIWLAARPEGWLRPSNNGNNRHQGCKLLCNAGRRVFSLAQQHCRHAARSFVALYGYPDIHQVAWNSSTSQTLMEFSRRLPYVSAGAVCTLLIT